MTDRLTTDELATELRRIGRENALQHAATIPVALDLAAELQLRLPYLDPADIAAVLLHASSCLAGLMAGFRSVALDERDVGTMMVNTMATAGERMHREARRDPKPQPPKNWGYS